MFSYIHAEPETAAMRCSMRGLKMLDFHSIDEILRFAMAKEDSSRRFYLDLSHSVTNPGTQAIFEALAHAEAHHQEAIKLELFKIGATVSSSTNTHKSMAPEPEPGFDTHTRGMSALEALEMAMKKQKASFQLFAELMAHTDNSEAREILYGLAEQEMRHLLQLEREYKALAPK